MKAVNQHVSTALILIVSILSLTPALAHADQQPQPEPFAIDATGQATAIGTGLSGATTLNLNAFDYRTSNQWLIIQNVTGSLKIGSTSFTVTGGQGSVTEAGAMAIFADTASGKGQLVLQGTMNENTVTFQKPSQLASISYLSLTGTVVPTSQQTPSIITNSAENTTTLVTSHENTTQQTNLTATSTSILQNTTTEVANGSLAVAASFQASNTTANPVAPNTSIGNRTMPALANGVRQHSVLIHVVQGQGEICLTSRYLLPVCTTASQTVAVRDGDLIDFDSDASSGFTWQQYDGLGVGQAQNFNANITQDSAVGVYFAAMPTDTANATTTINAPSDSIITTSTTVNAAPPTSNVTVPLPGNVTVTQSVNQTIFITQTVANYTISYTVTSTVANTTITQANITITSNATTTVSNKT
jgi:hypothetical protein